ncbi:uncharacterized protein LOC131680276 [Topomyia yanbarensis]|uniref:uncharacterized protein LOC131680276 n=1 Tax=Topomyia yanbarensis TaxID=2498891 RepID=UPI00273C9551|nr:uncharacterized protein LOC131680276 [Topomyia yanbarensis]
MQLRTIFAGVFLAMANAALILERLNDVLLAQGVYDFKVTLTYKSLVEDQAELESALNAFNETCTALIERIPNLKCGVITSVWSKDTSDIANINTYIRYFFKTRTPRGFWSAIGAMDSDDRTRIDENMDKLRRNEERFNKNTEHQASAIEKIYNFVSNSTITMNKAVESNNKNFESLKTEIRNTLNRANDRDKDLYLEATLMEIGMWYNSMRQNLKLKQKTWIAILHAENTKSLDLAEIINPVQLIRTLDSEEATLNDNLTFPRRADGAIMPEILNTLHYYVNLTNDLDIIMTLQIPLVKKSKWYAYKGTIEPSITGNILTILHLEEDIIIKQENNWGYVLTQADYDNCDRIGDTRLCKLSNIERDLKQEDTCMAALYFRNITTTCKTKVLQLNHDIWLETANRNIWTYFTPNKLKVSVFTGKNVTETTIQGKGNIKLLPDMMIQTDSIRITHFSETQGETKLTYHIPHTDIPNIWKDKGIPSLSKHSAEQEAITPNHFLLGSSAAVTQPTVDLADTTKAVRSTWHLIQYNLDHFCRRWIREYLPTLTRRTKWFSDSRAVQKGDLVVVIDDTKRNGWIRGKVLEVIPERDGRIKQAVVQTSTGAFRRPESKLAILEVNQTDKDEADTHLYGEGTAGTGSPSYTTTVNVVEVNRICQPSNATRAPE